MRNPALLRLLNGHMTGLHGDELERFFIYAYKISRHTRALIAFGMPVLFLVGGLHDATILDDANIAMLVRRSTLSLALLACAWLIHRRIAVYWRELAGIAWVLLCGTGIMLTTLHEPARLSLVHVVITLMGILLLPQALRPLAALGIALALVLPLLATLYLLDAAPGLWLSCLAFVLVGTGIGLIQRRAQLDGALEMFLLRKRLLARLHTDSLTGIFNREGWEVHARHRVKHMGGACGGGYAVVFFDLDHFKHVNDREGHAMGDQILRNAAHTMRAHALPGHILARFGGEEFVALLPGADEAAAWRHAEHVRRAIEYCPDNRIHLTASAGVAQARDGEALDSTLTRADAAMLEAKRRGRNQVLCASAITPDSEPVQEPLGLA